MAESEHIVVQHATNGDLDAQATLIRLHGPTLWALCRRLTDDPDDAYQAVWERVLDRLGLFDATRGTFRTWLLTLGHRLVIDRHRKRLRQPPSSPLQDVPSNTPSPFENTSSSEQNALLENAIHQLPDPQARVIVRHHLEGCSLAQIAHDEGVAVGTIKSRLHRARAALFLFLGDAQ